MSIKIMSSVWESGEFEGAALIMLLALADQANDQGWSWPSVEALQKKTRLAERTIYTTIKTLVDAGWLTKTQREGSKRVFYQVHPPALNAGDQSNPPAPDAVNAALSAVKTALHAKPPHPLKGRTVKNRQEPPGSLTLPEWLPAVTWNDYLQMRKKIKKPATEEAMRLAILALEKLRDSGNDPQEVLEQSILRSWQGLFEVHSGPNGNGGYTNGNSNGNHTKGERSVNAALSVLERIENRARSHSDGTPPEGRVGPEELGIDGGAVILGKL